MSVFDPLHQVVELGGRLLALVLPQPVAAVGIEPALVRRGIAVRLIREAQVVVEHIYEHGVVGVCIGRPHIIGVVVV